MSTRVLHVYRGMGERFGVPLSVDVHAHRERWKDTPLVELHCVQAFLQLLCSVVSASLVLSRPSM